MQPPPYNPYLLPPGSVGDTGCEERRRALLRRLKALLAAGLVACAAVTWFLVRFESPLTLAVTGPAAVVRAHLDALNRNDIEGAWKLFSADYREQFPFDTYEAFVAQHSEIFQTRNVEFRQQVQSNQRAFLVARLLAADGASYVARFTLVRSDGRWWIDDFRWTRDRSRRPLVTV